MKRYLMLGVLGLMLLGGCSTTYDVPRDSRADEFLEAKKGVQGRDVVVVLTSRTEIELTSATLLDDTIVGRNQISGNIQAIPLGKVFTVRAYDTWRGVGRGALQGICIYGGIGLVGGALWMASDEWIKPQDFGDVAAGAAVTAACGGLLGGLFGALAFSPYDYEFQPARGGVRKNQPPPVPPVRLTQDITLRLTAFQDETPDQVCIIWNGKSLWLPKSEVKIERDGEYVLLTVPERLLQDK